MIRLHRFRLHLGPKLADLSFSQLCCSNSPIQLHWFNSTDLVNKRHRNDHSTGQTIKSTVLLSTYYSYITLILLSTMSACSFEASKTATPRYSSEEPLLSISIWKTSILNWLSAIWSCTGCTTACASYATLKGISSNTWTILSFGLLIIIDSLIEKVVGTSGYTTGLNQMDSRVPFRVQVGYLSRVRVVSLSLLGHFQIESFNPFRFWNEFVVGIDWIFHRSDPLNLTKSSVRHLPDFELI